MEFDTSGELRKILKEDGWYVLGKGMLVPVRDEQQAEEIMEKLTQSNNESKN